jgi:hypothetical protein
MSKETGAEHLSAQEALNELRRIIDQHGDSYDGGCLDVLQRAIPDPQPEPAPDQARIARALYDIRSSHSHELLHREPDWTGEDAETWHEAELLIRFLRNDANPQVGLGAARESAEKVITAMTCALKPDMGRKLRDQWREEAMLELERHEREFPQPEPTPDLRALDDFQLMLARISHRLRAYDDPVLTRLREQVSDLLKRKGTLSPLRTDNLEREVG